MSDFGLKSIVASNLTVAYFSSMPYINPDANLANNKFQLDKLPLFLTKLNQKYQNSEETALIDGFSIHHGVIINVYKSFMEFLNKPE